MKAALGFRAHSGWAAMVALAGERRSPSVVDRRRIQIADSSLRGSKQPYHAAEGLEIGKARELLGQYAEGSRRLAREALREVAKELRKKGHQLAGAGLLLGSGRTGVTLEATLASHALIHTADGDHFRDALTKACDRLDLPVTGVREKELFPRAAATLRLSEEEIRRRVAEMGKAIGPPWTQDEKLSALAAWMVLAGS
jgi:hypothetical protein